MRRLPPLWLLAIAALTPSLMARSAHADDPSASALIEQGLDLRQTQRDAEALALFEKAQSISPSPRGQAQVALAQQALGRWLLAERNMRAALAAKGDTWIESRRPILEHAMTIIQGHLGDVEIVGAKAGTVYIDGVRVDEPDALTHLRLEVGRRAFELRAEGSYPFSRVLDVLPGEIVRVEVEQHALLDDPARPLGPGVPAPVVIAGSGGRTQRTIGWVGFAGAGAFLAMGVTGLIVRNVDAADFNGNSICTGKNSMSSQQCNDWHADGNTGQTIEIVGFVGGGILGALSVALLLTAAPAKPKTLSVSPACTPTRDGAWCSLGGTF